MWLHFRLLPALLAAALALSPTVVVRAAPLEWQSTEITLDAPPLAETVEAVFHFTNMAGRPVTITDVHSSCGCTVARLDRRIYVPEESGTIRAVFTIGERVGVQEKSIIVATAEPDVSSTPLTLRVRIPTLYEMKPYFVIWNTGEDPVAKSVALRLLAPDVLGFEAIESRHTSFDASAKNATGDPTTWTIDITPRTTAQPTSGGIEVTLKSPDGHTRKITIYALVREVRPAIPPTPATRTASP